MSIYSTIADINEGNYIAYIQSVGFTYISHIDIVDKKTNDSIWLNENHIEQLKFILGRDNFPNNVIKNDFVCIAKDGVSIFHLLATKDKVILYDNSNILYLDVNTFVRILEKVSNAISEFYNKKFKESE